MSATDIGVGGLAASAILIVVAVALSLAQGLRLAGTIAWAATRAGAQLLLVGVALHLVLSPGAPLALAWVWVAGMVVVAALTVRHRAPEVPGVFGVALLATGSVAVVSLGVAFGFGIFPLEARAVVPLAGMMVGNAMAATVLASRRVVGELRDKRDEVEARLALGHPSSEAARPYVREALRTALVPQIETTKTVGLIALPGAMTGLILAGVDPAQAVLVQVAVMYLILGSVTVSVTVVGLGVTRRLFTPDHRLRRLERPAG